MRLRAGDPAPRHTLDGPAHVVGNTELAVPYRTSVQKTAPPQPIPSTRSREVALSCNDPGASIIAPPGDSQHIDAVPAKRTHASGRPESECGTVGSYKRHQRRGETHRRGAGPQSVPSTASSPASGRRWPDDHLT
jgi:hypothetical protein